MGCVHNDRSGQPAPEPVDDSRRTNARLAACRALIREGQIIEKAIGARLFANPELAMLLDIYLAQQEGREPYLWEVCNATSIPVSTAHRKLGGLIDDGFIARTTNFKDRRRVGVRPTASTIAALNDLMDRLVG